LFGRLQQAVTSNVADEGNGDNDLTLIDEFEPFETESIKQEKENKRENQSIIEKVSKISTNIDLDGNLKNIVRYLALKIGDKVKNGLQIVSFSSYCEKVFSNEIRKFAARKKLEEAMKQKEESARRQFDNFVMHNFGERFADLGSFVQQEALRIYREATQPDRNPVPFYNWLEV
jgi:endo-alpha-1,4-polygalactosaminidase (GH114 family)